MTVTRMDNVGIVVEDLDAAVDFFTELGLELEGRAPIEGKWAEGVTGRNIIRSWSANSQPARRETLRPRSAHCDSPFSADSPRRARSDSLRRSNK